MFVFIGGAATGRKEENVAYEYAKVILYAYPRLEEMAEAVGIGAENKAYLSFRSKESALALAEKIAEELAVKSRLLRLKEAADAVVAACTEEERFLLEHKYFRRKELLGGRFAGMRLGCSERNYFRLQAALLKKAAAHFAAHGWTEEGFLRAFGSFSPFRHALAALSEGREKGFRRGKSAVCAAKAQNSEERSSRPAERLPRKTSTATATAAAQRMQMTAICTPPSPPPCAPSSPPFSAEAASR